METKTTTENLSQATTDIIENRCDCGVFTPFGYHYATAAAAKGQATRQAKIWTDGDYGVFEDENGWRMTYAVKQCSVCWRKAQSTKNN